MRQSKKKLLLEACKLSFDGKSDSAVAAELGVYPTMITRWRTFPLWKEFEQELIDAHKQSLLGAQPATLSEG